MSPILPSFIERRRARTCSARAGLDAGNGVDAAQPPQDGAKRPGTLHLPLFRMLAKDGWAGGCESAEEMDASHRRTLLFIVAGALAALWMCFMYAAPL